MEKSNFTKAGLLALVLVVTFVLNWELFWRSQGFPISYNDDESLWAAERSKVYEPSDKATVFIGSSRVKFDVDLDTWEKKTGEKTVQLSMPGTSPRPLLDHLANDENFKGKLIIGITEPLFFSPIPIYNMRADKGTAHYNKLTPSQKASFAINLGMESGFVFLEKSTFSISALLNQLPIPSRPGVFVFPHFPIEFEVNSAKRQSYMPDIFLRDTTLVNRQREIWMMLGLGSTKRGVGGDTLAGILHDVKLSIDKIKARGGQVMFVRAPSSGPIWAGEKEAYPRHLYWDRLLAYTETPGVHFEDYPETANFDCPEWSHLSPADAVVYTRHLISILQQDNSHNFLKKSISPSTVSSR